MQFPVQLKGRGRALGMFLSYLVWVWLFRLLTLSFVIYFMLPEPARLATLDPSTARLPRFEEISDVLGANELTLIGLSALFFVAFLRALHPLTTTTLQDIATWPRTRKHLPEGMLHGFVFATGIVSAFLLSGLYRNFGFSLEADELVLALPGIVLRIATIFFFVYCEEYVFRHKILGTLLRTSESRNDVIVATFATSTLYCLIKLLQFDLGILQTFTAFLVSMLLSARWLVDRDFVRGAAFWATVLIVFQPLLGLPVFGSEFAGVLLTKYQPVASVEAGASATAHYLTGGPAGPLAGFAFQFLLLVDLTRSILAHKKTLLQPPLNR